MADELVLSLFPGLDFLGLAFEGEGFCVVRGPDVIWGGDIRGWHPPAGRFDGVIGGPPCQEFSALAPLIRHNGYEPRFGNLIPEFERCVAEAAPAWFVMENVRGAPLPEVEGYDRWATLLKDSDIGGVQPRVRRISMGFREGLWTAASSPFALVEYADTLPHGTSVAGNADDIEFYRARKRTVTTNSAGGSFGDTRREPDSGRPGKRKTSVKADPRPIRREARRASVISQDSGIAYEEAARTGAPKPSNIGAMLEAQGLPPDYLDDAPFTVQGKRQAIGNGVPLSMGRAIARAVRKACSRLDE